MDAAPRPRKSIRARIGIAFGACSMILALLLSGILGVLTKQDLERDVGEQLTRTAAQIAQQFDGALFERVKDIEALTRRAPIRRPDMPIAVRRGTLDAANDDHAHYVWIGVTDLTGKITAATGGLLEGESLRGFDIFSKGLKGIHVSDVHNAPVFTQFIPSPDGSLLRVLDLSAPIHDLEGNLTGVICAHVSWEWARTLKEAVVRPLRSSRNLEAFLVNRAGVVLLAPSSVPIEGTRLKALPSGAGGMADDEFIWGMATSTGFQEFQGLGWRVIARRPISVAMAPIRRLQQRVLIFGATAGVLFGAAGWFMAGYLTRPLAKIAGAARQIARDDPTASLPKPARNDDELGALHAALNHLLDLRETQSRELQLSDERFRTALQNSGVIVFNHDRELRYTWIYNQIPGFSVTSVIGKTDSDILGEERAAELMALKRAVLEQGEPATRIVTLLLADGPVDWNITVRPLRDAKQEVIGVTCAAIDVTEQRVRERALRQALVQFSSTFENAAVGIALCGLDGRFRRVNDKLCEILGYPRRELLTRRFEDITHPDDLAGLSPQVRMLTAGDIPQYTVEKRYCRKDGEIVWVNAAVSLVRDEREAPDYLIAVVEDITARKRAEHALRESEARFRIAAECASDLIYDWDIASGTIEWFGDIDRVLGYEPGEIARDVKSWQTVVHPEDNDRLVAGIREHLATGKPFHEEYRVFTKDGSVRIWTDRGLALRDTEGKPYRWIGVNTDVTERKTAATQLEQAKEFAEAASRAKDDFLAALSHELRTPLNPVLMLASELENSPELSSTVREDFASIRKNIELEARLIDDLLDLTRVTRGKLRLNLETLDVHALLHKSLDICRTEVEGKQLIVTLDLSAPEHLIAADAVRLQQVFWNVIKNAVKFTAPGGTISIRTRNGARRTLLVEITDTGIGIEAEDLPRIFDAFAQGKEASSHRFGGLGLGLSISQLLMQSHGGSIRADSAGRGQGATFLIEVPLAPINAVAAPAPPALPASPSTRRILLIEDHEPTRSTLARLLRKRSHEVTAADNIATARELAAAGEFDLVISDLGLPDGNGQDLMCELHSNYGLEGIALSGYGMEEDVRRSLEVGFTAHLTKPVDISALERAIELVPPTHRPVAAPPVA